MYMTSKLNILCMTMFDVRYLYLFLDTYLIYIKGILKGSLLILVKKNYLSKETHQNIFLFICLLKKSSYQKKPKYLTLTIN
jgi:hypothetical protein